MQRPRKIYLHNKDTSLINESLTQLEKVNVGKFDKQQSDRLSSYKDDYDLSTYNTALLLNALEDSFKAVESRQEKTIENVFDYERKLREAEEERKRQEEARKRQEAQRALEEEKRRIDEEHRRLEREKAEQIKKAEEMKKKVEADKLAEKKRQEEALRRKGRTNWSEVAKELEEWRQEIINIKEKVVTPVNQNKDLKKSLNAIKRKVTVKFGQLSNSAQQCRTVCDEIKQFIELTRRNDQAYHWLLNAISKALISQAEAEVIVKPTAALPLALLTNDLLRRYPEFSHYLTARFVKKCCFVIGYSCSISTEEGRMRMGWKRTDDKWEDEVKYEERIGGIMTLWSAICRGQNDQNLEYYNTGAEWKAVARILNTDLSIVTNVHFVILSNWWEVCAQEFYNNYRKQAAKIFLLIERGFTEHGRRESCPAAIRLQLLVEECWKGMFNTIKPMEY